MAKQHIYSMTSLWMNGNQVVIKNQKVRLRVRVDFTITHTGDAVSTDHSMTLDLDMSTMTLIEKCLKTVVIDVQKFLRPLSAEKARAWLKEHDPVKYVDAYPGRKASVTKDMTPAEITAKCKIDPEFRKELLAELMEMEDSEAEENEE